MDKFIIYTDGGSRGNPGIAGCGAVITDKSGQILKKAFKSLGIATNNEAEYQAVILALETLKKIFGKEKVKDLEFEIKMDSELVCKQLNGEYQINEKLAPLFMKIWNERVASFRHLAIRHIPREENSLADGLANEAMDASRTKQNHLLEL